MRVASLFSGVGGLDVGLESAGLTVVSLCESWAPARMVLRDRFPSIAVDPDVRHFHPAGDYEVLAAGFPCTNISHVGDKSGLAGPASGLVSHVFRVAEESAPRWLVMENVPHLLTLHRGSAMRSITARLEGMGYRWAYRTVDSRFTGVPQRRPRVIILASQTDDPAAVILSQDAGPPADGTTRIDAAGFYWTEGRHGTGLVWGAVPTLKGGSTIGLGSTPAVWLRDRPASRQIVTLSVEHGEQLQGLPRCWTRAAAGHAGPDMRWKLVGNAVTTGVGGWLGRRLLAPDPAAVGVEVGVGVADPSAVSTGGPFATSGSWPRAASGGPGLVPRAHPVSAWPERHRPLHLSSVLSTGSPPMLSTRAAAGFLRRLEGSGLPFDPELREALRAQVAADHPAPVRRRPSRAAAVSV